MANTNAPVPFSGVNLTAGDSVKMTVNATGFTSGTATIENLTTGTSATHVFTNVTDGALCQHDAEWVVEDFYGCGTQGCGMQPLVNFGTLTFTDAYAIRNGLKVSPENATILAIQQNNKTLTDCSASATEVACTRINV